MKLYDALITETEEILSGAPAHRYDGLSVREWPSHDTGELVMMRDTAYELGGSGLPSVNYTCVTTSQPIERNEVIVVGRDLQDIHSDVPFARIAFLKTEDLGEETDAERAYRSIRNLEFIRYHVFPSGYMVRVSSQSRKEQVRISKKAIKGGITFASVGSLYISKYLSVPLVRHVRMFFVTEDALVRELQPFAQKSDDITQTLTHILDGLPTDCGHCQMKPVCDEVDGMRELHMGSGVRGDGSR